MKTLLYNNDKNIKSLNNVSSKKLKVLVTSGGTKIRIDRVRSITNMSNGTFGSQIVDSFFYLKNGIDIAFLAAKDSKLPKIEITDILHTTVEGRGISVTRNNFNYRFNLIPYITFDDYEKNLFALLHNHNFDVIILAAAVSDYGIENYVDGKIRSSDEEMIIRLKPLPKLISRVREAAPNSFIVGFKLLVDSTEDQLKQACIDSMNKNKLDMIVGNDLRDIQQDNHTLTLGFWNNNQIEFEKKSKREVKLSDYLVNKILENLK